MVVNGHMIGILYMCTVFYKAKGHMVVILFPWWLYYFHGGYIIFMCSTVNKTKMSVRQCVLW